MFSLIRAWTNGWANNRDAEDLRRHRAHYDVTVVMTKAKQKPDHEKHIYIYIYELTQYSPRAKYGVYKKYWKKVEKIADESRSL